MQSIGNYPEIAQIEANHLHNGRHVNVGHAPPVGGKENVAVVVSLGLEIVRFNLTLMRKTDTPLTMGRGYIPLNIGTNHLSIIERFLYINVVSVSNVSFVQSKCSVSNVP